jgi:hypothetical protein
MKACSSEPKVIEAGSNCPTPDLDYDTQHDAGDVARRVLRWLFLRNEALPRALDELELGFSHEIIMIRYADLP